MTQALLIPPVAFVLYLLLVTILARIGRMMAGTSPPDSTLQSDTYASGEAPFVASGAPGYRQFFLIAFFFAVLHIGVLVLSTGGLSLTAGAYLVGLVLALVALILG